MKFSQVGGKEAQADTWHVRWNWTEISYRLEPRLSCKILLTLKSPQTNQKYVAAVSDLGNIAELSVLLFLVVAAVVATGCDRARDGSPGPPAECDGARASVECA